MAVFTQARDAGASAEEYLGDVGWGVLRLTANSVFGASRIY